MLFRELLINLTTLRRAKIYHLQRKIDHLHLNQRNREEEMKRKQELPLNNRMIKSIKIMAIRMVNMGTRMDNMMVRKAMVMNMDKKTDKIKTKISMMDKTTGRMMDNRIMIKSMAMMDRHLKIIEPLHQKMLSVDI